MLVMGAVTVIEWDTLFPDRRDYASLVPLPIHARTLFIAKVSALLLFLIAFTATVNLSSTVLFPFIAVRGTLWRILVTVAVHGASILASSAFVFLFLIALEATLLNVLSVRWFRKVSVYVQCAMVFALLSVFFLFPNIAGSLEALKARNAALLYAYPPAWFLGLNEVMLGSEDPVFRTLAAWAGRALATVSIIAALGYSVAYRRHVQRTLESTEGGDATRSRGDEFIGRMADRLTPHPLHRATVAFIGKTMARSAKHRIFLAAYTGRWLRIRPAGFGRRTIERGLAVDPVGIEFLRSEWDAVHLHDSSGTARKLDIPGDGDGRTPLHAARGANRDALVRRDSLVSRAVAVLLCVVAAHGRNRASGVQRHGFHPADRSPDARFLEDSVHMFLSARKSEHHCALDLLLVGVHHLCVLDGGAGSVDGNASKTADPLLCSRRRHLVGRRVASPADRFSLYGDV